MENYTERMLNESDAAIDPVSDEELDSTEKNDDGAMQYLLDNERFIFEKPELQKPTVPPIKQVPDILLSRLRETNSTSLDASDSDSDDSMRHIQSHAPTNPSEAGDAIIGVPRNRSTREISDFILGLAIWAETKDITRQNYAALREILSLFTMPEMDDLPQSLSTLLS